MVSTLKVNTIQRQSGTSIAIGESGDTITITAGASLTGPIVASGLTGALPAISGASLTALTSSALSGALPALDGSALTNLPAETKPTISSISPSVIENTQTVVTITGTNFVSIPSVDAINATGGITPADAVSYTSATTIGATFTLGVDGTYYIRVENSDGNAVRSSTALLTVSDVPAWTTGSGSLGTIAGDFSGTVATVAATGDTVAYSETTSVLTNASLANCSLNSSTGVITTSDFGGSSTTATTYSFTLRATDAQAQTADRNFTLTSSFGIGNSGRFDV